MIDSKLFSWKNSVGSYIPKCVLTISEHILLQNMKEVIHIS